MFEDLGDLARGVAENDVSRGQAIKWPGYSVLGAALSSVGYSECAEALTRKARRRCRRKGGTPLEKGQCHCGFNCGEEVIQFSCHNDPGCLCWKDVSGRGFCGRQGTDVPGSCAKNSDCPSGYRCVVHSCAGNFCSLPCPS